MLATKKQTKTESPSNLHCLKQIAWNMEFLNKLLCNKVQTHHTSANVQSHLNCSSGERFLAIASDYITRCN